MFPTTNINSSAILEILSKEILSAPTYAWNISSINSTLATITTTTTGNKTVIPPERNPYFVVLVEIICILVLLLGIFGNSLVLIVFCTRWKKLKTCEVYMINLAVSDLISTIIIPTKMFFEIMQHSFHDIGDNGCKIISFLSMLPMTVSSLTLLIISIDRFTIVKWPLKRTTEKWKIGGAVLLTWLVAASMSSWYLFGDRIRLYADQHQDHLHFCGAFQSEVEKKAQTLIVQFVQIYAPMLTMSILYTLIIHELRKIANCQMFKKNQREIKIRLKRNRRATCLFLTIVAVFYTFALPISVFLMIYTFHGITMSHNSLFVLFTFFQMIQMLNSCANPIIYSNLHTSFRRTTLKLLCSCVFTRFKSYEWGDSLRSAIRSSTRSVRTSISMQSFRSKGHGDSFYNNNRRSSSKLGGSTKRGMLDPRLLPYSPTKTTSFEDFNHMQPTQRQSIASSIFDDRRKTLNEDDIGSHFDDVFDETTCFNHVNDTNGSCKKKLGRIASTFKFRKQTKF